MLRLMLIAIILFGASVLQAAPSIQICWDGEFFRVSGLNDIGWDAATGGGGFEGDVLVVAPLEDSTIQIVFWWTDESGQDHSSELWGTPDTPSCHNEGWQPSAPSILIPADGPGPYLLEIQDAYGHWHLVTDAVHLDGIVLYNHAGYVELIGSVGQDEDATHYRLIEVNND